MHNKIMGLTLQVHVIICSIYITLNAVVYVIYQTRYLVSTRHYIGIALHAFLTCDWPTGCFKLGTDNGYEGTRRKARFVQEGQVTIYGLASVSSWKQ